MKKLLTLSVLFTAVVHAQEQKFTVYFDTAKDVPSKTSLKTFDTWLAANKNAQVVKIYAYTDSVGNEEYNFKLSTRRNVYVTKRLADYNLVQNTEFKSLGEKETQTGIKADNRRVDIYYNLPPENKMTDKIKAAKKGDKIRLEHLNFYENSTTMLPEAKPVLEELLASLKALPTVKIEIQGHVCCQIENHEKLSFRRALMVYNYLVDNGIDPARLSHTGFGSTRPIYPLPEKNFDQIVANRRVEIEILEK
jgi:outer membrane protein OmpA-like peptidoglycan-associated protein